MPAKLPSGEEQDLFQLAVYILYDDSTGWEQGDSDDDFATDADIMIYIVYEDDFDEDSF